MLMEHFLCDDVGGKRNVCGMVIKNYSLKGSFLLVGNKVI